MSVLTAGLHELPADTDLRALALQLDGGAVELARRAAVLAAPVLGAPSPFAIGAGAAAEVSVLARRAVRAAHPGAQLPQTWSQVSSWLRRILEDEQDAQKEIITLCADPLAGRAAGEREGVAHADELWQRVTGWSSVPAFVEMPPRALACGHTAPAAAWAEQVRWLAAHLRDDA
ncbi:hypothetical protein ACFC1T_09260 [Kitasatospora sp. NPDC056076]|uniref:hypothetical protein n=1 Tax=Kitasatospora sp. NPDC056076 TaxID=3345703 RepID=UPI0035DF32DE